MSLLDAIGRALSGSRVKASAAGRAIVAFNLGRPVWTPRRYDTIARKTFVENAVVFACVRRKAEALASVPLELYQAAKAGSGKETELTAHPILSVLEAPNPLMSYADLVTAWSAYLDIAGNSYLEGVTRADGVTLLELYAHRPDRMTITPDARGWPGAYTYKNGGYEQTWAVDPARDQVRPIWHSREFNPVNDWYGMGAAEAALNSVDIVNAQKEYAKALLDNAATPSGAFVYEGDKDGGSQLTGDQRNELRKEIEDRISGAKNAGRPLILGGGLKWQAMGSSLKDLEWTDATASEARQIALAFGVPPLLLGIPGDNTFANYEEANRAFWRETVIPRLRRWTGGLTQWLCAPLSSGLRLAYDEDAIPALADERRKLFAMIEASTFLTIDEKREACGYAATPGGNVILVPAANVPLDAAAAPLDMGETGQGNGDQTAPLN